MLDKDRLNEILLETTQETLNELKQTSFKYGCLMLYFDVTKTWWDQLQDLIDERDIVRVNGTYGREKYFDAHVTLMYGFHTDLEIEKLKEKVQGKTIRDIRPTKISYFETPEYDVVKLEVDYVFLKELNKECKKFPHTSSFPKYVPHMTLAYVRKGLGKVYEQKIKTSLLKTIKAKEFVFSEKTGKKTKFKLK